MSANFHGDYSPAKVNRQVGDQHQWIIKEVQLH